ncbi:hypothetical protein [Citrobacter freundii]|uniref:hypothetical protein n=1 Tax=Citrobacter freundii TaxID=546 RepID=UPI001902D22E|nr:hypothetical protein [Citrobacter freundii]MBJ8931579.1 hypothetical protein [Citrobacter freundii]
MKEHLTTELASERAFGEFVGVRVATAKSNREKAEIIALANTRINELNTTVDNQHAELVRLRNEVAQMTSQRNMSELMVVTLRQTLEAVIDDDKAPEAYIQKTFRNVYNKKKIDFIKGGMLTEDSFRNASIFDRMKNTVNFISRMFK